MFGLFKNKDESWIEKHKFAISELTKMHLELCGKIEKIVKCHLEYAQAATKEITKLKQRVSELEKRLKPEILYAEIIDDDIQAIEEK